MWIQMSKFILLLIGIFTTLNIEAQAINYGQYICKQPGYSCITIGYNQSWNLLWPNAEERDVVQRLNRMNIPLQPGMTIAVPLNRNLTAMDIAPFTDEITPQNTKVIVVSLQALAWGAYSETGKLVKWGPISGGKNFVLILMPHVVQKRENLLFMQSADRIVFLANFRWAKEVHRCHTVCSIPVAMRYMDRVECQVIMIAMAVYVCLLKTQSG